MLFCFSIAAQASCDLQSVLSQSLTPKDTYSAKLTEYRNQLKSKIHRSSQKTFDLERYRNIKQTFQSYPSERPSSLFIEDQVAWMDAQLERYAGAKSPIERALMSNNRLEQQRIFNIASELANPSVRLNEQQIEKKITDLYFGLQSHMKSELAAFKPAEREIREILHTEIAKKGVLDALRAFPGTRDFTLTEEALRGWRQFWRHPVIRSQLSLTYVDIKWYKLHQKWLDLALDHGIDAVAPHITRVYRNTIEASHAINHLRKAMLYVFYGTLTYDLSMHFYKEHQERKEIKKLEEDLNKLQENLKFTPEEVDLMDDTPLSGEDAKTYGKDRDFRRFILELQKKSDSSGKHKSYLPGTPEFKKEKELWYQ